MTPSLTQAFGLFFQAHPWHGVSPGDQSPDIVTSYIEMVPTDAVKYEVDKATGILKLDRPQRFSSQPPSLYGFIPRTFCNTKVGQRCSERVGRPGIQGDGDPMDICVLTEKPIQHGAILIEAIPIGGLRMIDGSQADDKIIAVLKGDSVYGGWKDVAHVPTQLIDRLRHYFLTYKLAQPGSTDVAPQSAIAGAGCQAAVPDLWKASTMGDLARVTKLIDAGADINAPDPGFGVTPRVAMISYSNFGSVRHPDVARVQAALELVRARRPELEIDGEMQPEMALDEARRGETYPFSTLTRNANTLVFDRLAAGNAARSLALTDDERAQVATWGLMTAKPVLYCCNVGEEDLPDGNQWTELVKARAANEQAGVVVDYVTTTPLKFRQWNGYSPEPDKKYLTSIGRPMIPDQWHVEASTETAAPGIAVFTRSEDRPPPAIDVLKPYGIGTIETI